MDAALDGLFAAVPEEFVATRDRIARDLKSSGDDDVAAQVKRLKRPTLATWSLNQAGREHPDEVAAYLDASRALRQVQEHGGDRDALLAAMRGHRAAQQALADLAVGQAATRPGDAERVRTAVQETLEAAALDEGIADALRRGRLTATERSVSAFDVLDVQPSAGTRARSTRATARRPEVDRARREEAQAALAAAEQASAAARAELAEAEELVEERRHRLEAAERAEREARDELRQARSSQ
jgi:hypothetical protein